MIILSMMVASAMMTLTLALSGGYAAGVALPWRQMVGADILIYPNRYLFDGQAPPGTTWEWRPLDPDQPTDARTFHPSLARGYLSPTGAPPAYFDLRSLLPAIQATPGVEGVEPARLLQAFVVVEKAGGRTSRVPVILRGRNIAADVGHFGVPDVIASGRYFRDSQNGDWVALVNRVGLGGNAPATGGRLTLEVPTFTVGGGSGPAVPDLAAAKTFYFLVYGQAHLELGTVHLTTDLPVDQIEDYIHTGPPTRWPVAIDFPEVWVPAGTFDQVYEAVAGQPLRYSGELCARTTDMFAAKEVAATLAALLPDATVVTVPQEVSLSGLNYTAAVTGLDPYVVTVTRNYFERSAVPLDVKTELSFVAFAVAGLLIVANMYILVTQRRREIGILKAIGAAGRDVLVLFLTETLGYALIGSLLGFGVIRLLTLLSLFSSPASLVEGGLLTLKALGVVTGLTVGTASIFGFLPAWEAARTPSSTLLGDS